MADRDLYETDTDYFEQVLLNAERALETVHAAVEKDIDQYEELTGIEGPDESSNYFGVIRYFLKEELENATTVAEHIWEHGEEEKDRNPFGLNDFEHYQEVIQTTENLEHYFENIDPEEIREGKHDRGLQAALEWTVKLERSLSQNLGDI